MVNLGLVRSLCLSVVFAMCATSAKAIDMPPEYYSEAMEQYMSTLGYFSGAPDETWDAASDDALDRLRRDFHDYGFTARGKMAEPGNPPHIIDLMTAKRLVGQAMVVTRKNGVLIHNSGSVEIRAIPSYGFDHEGDGPLPLDWCVTSKSGTTYVKVTMTIDPEEDALINVVNGSGSKFDDAFWNHMIPALKEHCPAAITPSQWPDQTAQIGVEVFFRGYEFYQSAVPSKCPGRGSETGMFAYVSFTAKEGVLQRELGLRKMGFYEAAEMGQGKITIEALDVVNEDFWTSNGRLQKKCVKPENSFIKQKR